MSTFRCTQNSEQNKNECSMKQHDDGTIKQCPYQLTEKPDVVEWKPTYFIYVEKKGNFKETAKAAWGQFFANVEKIDAQAKREKHVSLYRMDEQPWVYRAGYTTSSKPTSLPDGYHCIEFEGGFYLRFILTGSYEHLGEACGRVWNIVGTNYQQEVRKDWNLENYVNDFKQVKPEELKTEILIPIKSGKVENVAEYQLSEQPQHVEWKPYYYVYVEKKGPFQDIAKACWDEMKVKLSEIKAQATVDKFIAQYRTDTEPWVYRAGVTVSARPKTLPSGYNFEEFTGGSFLSFTLNGGYNHLPEACGRVFNIVGQKYSNDVRKDWNIEYYVNDPSHTKPQDLITQIMVPVNKKYVPYIPTGYHSIQTYLCIPKHQASKAIAWYEQAFGAKEIYRLKAKDEKQIMHAEMQFGTSRFMLSDYWTKDSLATGNNLTICFYTPCVDSLYQRAIKAGAKGIMSPMTHFYGDRSAQLEDIFGVKWSIATHVEDVDHVEMQRRAYEMEDSMCPNADKENKENGNKKQ